MTEDSRLMFKISELTLHSLNGTLDAEGLRQLEKLFEENPAAVEYYQEILWTFVGMKSMEGILCLLRSGDSGVDSEFWQVMQQEEKVAPAIEIPKEKTSHEIIQKVVYPPKVKKKLNKFTIFTLINSAAILLFFFLLKYVTMDTGVEVATLTDSMNAKWTDTGHLMEKGTRLTAGNSELCLMEGLAELLFDNNTKVVIEGPAKFELLAEDRIRLNYGNIYSSVPPEAIGFSIFTQNTKIFDMGTEFGVEADFRGNTLLHVLKGSTMLVTGEQSGKKGIEVKKGFAKKILADNSKILDISCEYNYFVRDIDSQKGMVWRGKNLNLASIVAGLDGFQEIGSLRGLDPVTGGCVTSISIVGDFRKSNKVYNLVPNLPFIDGVFVPDGESGSVQITSLGHTFNCPDTSGKYTHDIAAFKGSIKNQHTTIPPVIINGQEVVKDPVVMLHSNVGITFDLRAIRESLPQLNLESLRATGIPMQESTVQDFVFWLLVDGQIKYERKIVKADSDRGPIPINIEINPGDQFLTLIVTDGLRGEEDKRACPYSYDFFYLINPELCLTDRLEGDRSNNKVGVSK
jgi:hypothetical protein